MTEEPKIIIEKGIPMPTEHRFHKGKWKDHLRIMEPGDSFAVPPNSLTSLRATIPYFVRRHAKTWQFVVKKDKTGKYRCWRLK